MKLSFVKMHGCGNDYIYFDGFANELPEPSALSVRLSDRHFGVGGDGVVYILPSETSDVRMRMFNADGSEGKMCGNAIRCVAKYAYEHGYVGTKNPITVETLSGEKTLTLTVEEGKVTSVRVDMGAPILTPADIPVKLTGETVVDREVTVAGGKHRITCVSMGNPHQVLFFDSEEEIAPKNLDLEKIGPAFENDPLFHDRVNTEFAYVHPDRKTVTMRVWERGSGETFACGTGTCATVVAATLCGYVPKNTDITVHLRGGDLVIRYTDTTVFMTGPATVAFEGTVETE